MGWRGSAEVTSNKEAPERSCFHYKEREINTL